MQWIDVDEPVLSLPRPSKRLSMGRSGWVLLSLAILAAAVSVLYLFWDIKGPWSYALPRRSEQLLAFAIVGVATGLSTVMFQTLTGNRILSPSIMGFEALYGLLNVALAFFLGAQRTLAIDSRLIFAITMVLLVGLTLILFGWVMGDGTRGLFHLVLVGVVAATLFGSLSTLMIRLMDPNEFDVLRRRLVASFNTINDDVLWFSFTIVVLCCVATSFLIPKLDVLTLGRDRAIALGLNMRSFTATVLILVSILVATSTALVGPITFLGLLAANLAYQLTKTYHHRVTLPAAGLIGFISLALAQSVLVHAFSMNATVGSLVNGLGGMLLLFLLIRETT